MTACFSTTALHLTSAVSALLRSGLCAQCRYIAGFNALNSIVIELWYLWALRLWWESVGVVVAIGVLVSVLGVVATVVSCEQHLLALCCKTHNML